MNNTAMILPVPTKEEALSPTDRYLQCEQEKNRATIEQARILSENVGDKKLEALAAALRNRPQWVADEAHTASVEDFLSNSSQRVQREGEPRRPLESGAGSRGARSVKLDRLIKERFPAEGREERIRRAKEHPLPTLKIRNLTPEQIKYFAEDVELEYDV